MEALRNLVHCTYVSFGTAGEKLSVLGGTSSTSLVPAKTGGAGTVSSNARYNLGALHTGSIDFLTRRPVAQERVEPGCNRRENFMWSENWIVPQGIATIKRAESNAGLAYISSSCFGIRSTGCFSQSLV